MERLKDKGARMEEVEAMLQQQVEEAAVLEDRLNGAAAEAAHWQTQYEADVESLRKQVQHYKAELQRAQSGPKVLCLRPGSEGAPHASGRPCRAPCPLHCGSTARQCCGVFVQ